MEPKKKKKNLEQASAGYIFPLGIKKNPPCLFEEPFFKPVDWSFTIYGMLIKNKYLKADAAVAETKMSLCVVFKQGIIKLFVQSSGHCHSIRAESP